VSFIRASICALNLRIFSCSFRSGIAIGNWCTESSGTLWFLSDDFLIAIDTAVPLTLVGIPSCHVLRHNGRTSSFLCSSTLHGLGPGSCSTIVPSSCMLQRSGCISARRVRPCIAHWAASALSNHIPSDAAAPRGESLFLSHAISSMWKPLLLKSFSRLILAMLSSLSTRSGDFIRWGAVYHYSKAWLRDLDSFSEFFEPLFVFACRLLASCLKRIK